MAKTCTINATVYPQPRQRMKQATDNQQHTKNSQVVVAHAAVVPYEADGSVAAGAEGVEAAALGAVQVVQHHRRGVLRPPEGVELIVSELHQGHKRRQQQQRHAFQNDARHKA